MTLFRKIKATALHAIAIWPTEKVFSGPDDDLRSKADTL